MATSSAMRELTSPVPENSRLAVKNVKTMESLSEETLAYTATLYFDGKRVGAASNHGQGGPDDFHYDDPAMREAVEAYAREHGDGFEPPSEMVANLLAQKDDERDVKRAVKQGFRFVVLAMKGAYHVGDDPDPDEEPSYSQAMVGYFMSRADFVRHADADGVEAFRVLHEEV